MKRDLMIVGAYPNTPYSIEVLRQCIASLHSEFDVMLVTHYPAPIDIQHGVKYYVYDNRNELIKNHSISIWVDTPNFYAEIYPLSEYGHHGYAVYSLIRNGISLMKDHYDSFFYSEGDCIWHPNDVQKLKAIKQKTHTQGKQSWFHRQNYDSLDCLVFYSTISFYEDVFRVCTTPKMYEDVSTKIGVVGMLENYYHCNIDYLKRWDDVLVDSTSLPIREYFPSSKIDALTYHKNSYRAYISHIENSNEYAVVFLNEDDTSPNTDMVIKVNGRNVMTVGKGRQYKCAPIGYLIEDEIELDVGGHITKYEKQGLENGKSFVRLKT